jgi:hypothetical protein
MAVGISVVGGIGVLLVGRGNSSGVVIMGVGMSVEGIGVVIGGDVSSGVVIMVGMLVVGEGLAVARGDAVGGDPVANVGMGVDWGARVEDVGMGVGVVVGIPGIPGIGSGTPIILPANEVTCPKLPPLARMANKNASVFC